MWGKKIEFAMKNRKKNEAKQQKKMQKKTKKSKDAKYIYRKELLKKELKISRKSQKRCKLSQQIRQFFISCCNKNLGRFLTKISFFRALPNNSNTVNSQELRQSNNGVNTRLNLTRTIRTI